MAKRGQTEIGLLILAGVGAGTLIGAVIGLVLGRSAIRRDGVGIADTVDDLRERAQQVLGELSDNVSRLAVRSRALLDEADTLLPRR